MLEVRDAGLQVEGLWTHLAKSEDDEVTTKLQLDRLAGVVESTREAGLAPRYVHAANSGGVLRHPEAHLDLVRPGIAIYGLPPAPGVGGGFDYGHNGLTHYALEDIALMRTQPAMTTLIPADADQARAAVDATPTIPGPVYLRVAKAGAAVPGLDGRFDIGRLAMIGDAQDLAIVAAGSTTAEAVEAAELLASCGVDAGVAVVSSFNPSPEADLVELLARPSAPPAVVAEIAGLVRATTQSGHRLP